MKDGSYIVFDNYDINKTSTYLAMIWKKLKVMDKQGELAAFVEDLQNHYLEEFEADEDRTYIDYYVSNANCMDDIPCKLMEATKFIEDSSEAFAKIIRSVYSQCTSTSSVYDTDTDKFDCFKDAIHKRCGGASLILVSSFADVVYDIVPGVLWYEAYTGSGFEMKDEALWDTREIHSDNVEINAKFDISNFRKPYVGMFMVVTMIDNFGVNDRIAAIAQLGSYANTIEQLKKDQLNLRMNIKIDKVEVVQVDVL
jgi:hypothetical protein